VGPERKEQSRHNGRRLLIWLWPGVAFLGLMVLAAFQPGPGSATAATGQTPALNWAGVVARLVLAFVVVAGLAYGGIWLLKRWMNRNGESAGNGVVSLVATSYVAPKKQISVVRVFDRLLVVGVAETGLTLLTEIGPEEAEEKLRGLQGKGVPDSGFLSLLKRQAALTRRGL